METEQKKKYIAAEMTEKEHHVLMSILTGNLSHNQEMLNELRFKPMICTCGECDKDEHKEKFELAHKNLLEGIEKGVKTLETLRQKLS